MPCVKSYHAARLGNRCLRKSPTREHPRRPTVYAIFSIIGQACGERTLMPGPVSCDLEAPVPGTDRRDETGAMARAVLVFKEGMKQAERKA